MGSKEKMKEGKKEERKNFGVRRRFPSVSALEFRCCGEIPFVDPKLLTKESAVSRGYRRAGQTELITNEFIVI